MPEILALSFYLESGFLRQIEEIRILCFQRYRFVIYGKKAEKVGRESSENKSRMTRICDFINTYLCKNNRQFEILLRTAERGQV
jgi:hypothetical protein